MFTSNNSVRRLAADGNARVHIGNNVYGSESQCLAELRTTDPRHDKKRIEESKGPLIREVSHWALKSHEYQQWVNNPSVSFLWLTGERGRGKTMLLCEIINEIETSPLATPVYVFCQRSKDGPSSHVGVLRSLFRGLETIQRHQLINCGLARTSIDRSYSSLGPPPHDINLVINQYSSLLSLEMNHTVMAESYKTFVQNAVDQLARSHEYDDFSREIIAEYFLANTEGSLLWVSSVCQKLSHDHVGRAGSTTFTDLRDELERIGQTEWNLLGHRQLLLHQSPNKKHSIFPISMSDVANFVWRSEMERIDHFFERAKGQQTSSSLVLYGTAGSGKTQLAMHYCRKAGESHFFGGVLWIDGASIHTVTKSMLEAAQTIFTADVSQWNAEQTRSAVFRLVATSKRPWVLVLDNFDNPKAYDVESVLPRQESKHFVIITSRSRDTRRLASSVEVTSLQEDEALKLLLGSSAHAKGTNDSAVKVIRRLGCLALAVAQAGAYISDRNMGLEYFLVVYESEQKRIHASVPLNWGYQRRNSTVEHARVDTTLCIATTWELSLDILSGDSDTKMAKTQLLVLSAFFGRNTITENLISTYFLSTNHDGRPQWMNNFTLPDGSFDSYALREAITEMGRLCLLQFYHIELHGASWGFHPVVQDWAMHRSVDDSSQALLAAEIMQYQLGHYQPTWVLTTIDSGTGYSNHTSLRPHVLACHSNCEKLLPREQSLGTSDTAMIALRFAGFFHSDGSYATSMELLQRVIARNVSGSNVHCLALRQLAETLGRQEEWLEASEIQQKVLNQSTEAEGTLDFAFLQAELAYMLQYQASQPEKFPDHADRMNKGLELASSSYATITGLEGEDSVAASASMWLLSAIAYHQKDFETAKRFGQRVVTIREKIFGSQNLSTVEAKENLAVFLAKLGQGAEAATIHEEDRSVLAAAYGPNHPKTLEAERMLARAWRLSKQFEKAIKLGKDILNRALEQYDPQHHDTERAANGLWRTYVAVGDMEEARKIKDTYNLSLSDADNELLRESLALVRERGN
ncbi:hypothetical protein CCUS01_05866 [Colletotrichum cuscutae]|uniref:AAA+ ATPase domain-containing protein n=1 Tax=Colletotrichum cuscutae TaxID=1209917 RepID=A0AAI9Y0V7_9PEZI|nr:hypothetical protein CCUS01_05866 [Colletotrichum cuscutae]